MYIRNLVENTCHNPVLGSEHGLSFYIETKKHKLLFDTGASDQFARNADTLGIDLTKVDTVIISHGHYDHGGGIQAFLERNHTARVLIRQEAFGNLYSHKQGIFKYNGFTKELCDHPQLELVNEDVVIDEELQLFAGVKERVLFPESNRTLYEESGDGVKRQDAFAHEQNLIIRQGTDETLITGCAHSGIVNILNRYDQVSRGQLRCVIGGFHLINPSLGKTVPLAFVQATARELQKRQDVIYYTGHCTGADAFAVLHDMMGDQIRYISTGEKI